MRSAMVLMAAGLALAACAKSPESIAPAYVSEMNYQNWTCPQLAEESARVDAALATASAQQKHARSNDTMGVLFLGLPVSTLSGGNVAAQIANLKGEKEAIAKAAIRRNCGLPAPVSSS